jgi:hypothetical protein
MTANFAMAAGSIALGPANPHLLSRADEVIE